MAFFHGVAWLRVELVYWPQVQPSAAGLGLKLPLMPVVLAYVTSFGHCATCLYSP